MSARTKGFKYFPLLQVHDLDHVQCITSTSLPLPTSNCPNIHQVLNRLCPSISCVLDTNNYSTSHFTQMLCILKITTPHIMAREFGKSFHRNWISNQRGHGQVASWTPWQRGQMKRLGQDWQMTREWDVTCLKVWQSRAVWYCLAQDIYNDVIMMSSQAFTF